VAVDQSLTAWGAGEVGAFLIRVVAATAVGAALGWLGLRGRRHRAAAAARREREGPPGEAYIGINVAYCDGRCWTWGAFAKLYTLEHVAGPPQLLRFTFEIPTRYGYDYDVFLVPVPTGRATEADAIMDLYTRAGDDPGLKQMQKAREERLKSEAPR